MKPGQTIVFFLFFSTIILLSAISVIHQKQASEALPTSTPLLFIDAEFTVNIPDKALIKNYLTVSLETDPDTACKLTFIPPSGAVREMETIADTNGLCEWRWKIEETDGRGAWTLDLHRQRRQRHAFY
ncbi:MAG: hypothetical protein OHK003_02240 [Anaerolineales bacterium]